jgi:acyl-coenzyme A thioesterase PaaI-like protein
MKAIQDAIPHNDCFGCGPQNPAGLRIRSFVEGEETVCRFQPSPAHMAGPTHVLNGGVIATVIDCHSVCTAIADLYRSAGREVGEGEPIWAVTASMKVDYLAPAPIGEVAELRARVVERAGRKRRVTCSFSSGGKECARGEVLAIEVRQEWTKAPDGA